MSHMRVFHWIILLVSMLVLLRAAPAHPSDFLPWIKSLVIDPQTPTTLYAGTSGGGVFKSTNGGASWNQTGLTNLSVLSLAIDSQTPTKIYAGSYDSSVFKSIDGGATWLKIINGIATCPTTGLTDVGLITSLAIDPVVPTTLYAALYCYSVDEWGVWTSTGGAVNKSTDGGATWSFSSLSAGVLALAIDPVTPTTLYAGTEQIPGFYFDDTVWGDVFISTDGGRSWVAINTYVGSVLALAIAPGTPSTGYAGTSSGLVVSFSTEGCCGFVLLNDGAWAIAIDPQTPTTLYAGGGIGVQKSTDGGATWTATGLNFTGVLTLSIDPVDSNTLYAGTYDGVYKSTDGGATWSLTGPIEWTYVSSVSVDPSEVTGGSLSTGTVTLTTPAPEGGITVALSTSNPAVATVPSSVTVPVGSTSANFTVSTSLVTTSTQMTISGNYGGVYSSTVLTVTPPLVPLSSVSLNPTSVTGGTSSIGTVTLSAAAPPGGATVVLSSNNPSAATVPPSVTVPAGATSANFTVSTVACASGVTTVLATYGGVTISTGLDVTLGTTDIVAIQSAAYFANRQELRVSAKSTSSTATLRVFETSSGGLIGTLSNLGDGKFSGRFIWSVNPRNITVRSSSCGSATGNT